MPLPVQSRPPPNIPFIKTLVKNLYGIEVSKVKELNGYDDRNYYVQTKESKEFLVKITNSDESNETGVIGSINSAILHLYNNGIRVTVPQINNRGTYLTFERIPSPEEHSDKTSSDKLYAFRVLEYIPGKLLLDVPFTPAILQECGEFLAKISIALETLSNPVLSVRIPVWSLLSTLKLRPYVDSVDSPLHRSIINNCIDEFESQVMNRLDGLEHCIIHGDFNEQNIIVDTTSADKEYHVKGVIDFSDVHFAPKVFDLAIFLAYSMLEFKAGPQIMAPGFGLLGYLRHKKLTENELNVLYYCIKARLCQSLVMGAHTYRINPSNVYVLSSAEKGWPALRSLHDCQPNDILNKWLNIEKYLQN